MIRLVEDVWESVDLQPCALRPCETDIGLNVGVITARKGFVPFYEITSPGKPAARFCVDCGGWLREAMLEGVTA